MPQDASKKAPRRPKTSPRRFTAPQRRTQYAPRRAKEQSRRPKAACWKFQDASGGHKTPPRQPQDVPRRPQAAPRRVQDVPRDFQYRSKFELWQGRKVEVGRSARWRVSSSSARSSSNIKEQIFQSRTSTEVPSPYNPVGVGGMGEAILDIYELCLMTYMLYS